MNQNSLRNLWTKCLSFLLPLVLLTGCMEGTGEPSIQDLADLPEFDGSTAYVVLHDNEPEFTQEERQQTESFETYSDLDDLGRCGIAYANVSRDTMPTEKRGSIGQVKPSGWQTAKYDSVDGKYLYNRCHLIGYQLTAENANRSNLITGTRYLNVEGMLPFENLVADYVKETGNHVLYRVTPDFRGQELVARGVQMEGWSVEDQGEGLCFHVYAYNQQPGICIDYETGESWRDDGETKPAASQKTPAEQDMEETYILNTSSNKFHRPDCPGAAKIKSQNRQDYQGSRDHLIQQGYAPCGQCHP